MFVVIPTDAPNHHSKYICLCVCVSRSLIYWDQMNTWVISSCYTALNTTRELKHIHTTVYSCNHTPPITVNRHYWVSLMLSACVGRKRERASGWGREEEEAVISLKCRVCRLIVLLTSSKITARHKKKRSWQRTQWKLHGCYHLKIQAAREKVIKGHVKDTRHGERAREMEEAKWRILWRITNILLSAFTCNQ